MRRLLVLIFLFASGLVSAQQVQLSDQAQISIITLGPDQKEFYEAFGHSAIRVSDPAFGIDYAYNYGVFSFNQPNFYLNFTKGHLLYQLGVYPYPDFKDAYISYNRFVHEQVLNLTPDQKRKVFRYLQWNARPENKSYYYDYFFNNCSTRIRDVFAQVLENDIQFDGSFIKTHYTIRELERLYLDQQPWGDLGINIGLGLPIDKVATPYEYMYLPDYLEYSFDHALIQIQGAAAPIVKEKIMVYQSRPEIRDVSFISPWKVFGFTLLLTLVLTVLDARRKKLSSWFDIILLSVTGLLGAVLLFLWFGTDHHACVKNFNLLWALPTNLVAGIFLLREKKPAWLIWYFKLAALVGVLILLSWKILPQQFTLFLMPLIIALVIRYVANWQLLKSVRQDAV